MAPLRHLVPDFARIRLFFERRPDLPEYRGKSGRIGMNRDAVEKFLQ